MDRQTVIAIVLSLLVLIGWNVWYTHRYGDVIQANLEKSIEKKDAVTAPKAVAPGAAPAENPASSATPFGTSSEEESKEKVELKPIDPTQNPLVSGGDAGILPMAEGEERPLIDTGVSLVTLSNVGGIITSWKLPGYINDDGEQIELVKQAVPLKPLSFEFSSQEATKKINSSLFGTNTNGTVTLSDSKPEHTVIYSKLLDTGFTLEKRITFRKDSYHVDVEVRLTHPTAKVAGSIFSVAWYGLGENIKSIYSYNGPVILQGVKRVEEQPDEDEPEVYEGNIQWAGLSNKYYAAAFFPTDNPAKVITKQTPDDIYATTLQLVVAEEGKPIRFGLYAGPKAISELKKEGKDFPRVINYGWFNVIAKPLYSMLIWFYSISGNFGWAIILLTVIIKVLFFPLTQKSFKSMNKMRKIQPEMKIVQDRYKNNKQKLNEELIALYRKHNVNPMSGCLPMLLQIPVFIALYKVLLESIELKGAPFMLWIADLSAKDPYYITPLVMGVTMFLQQKLSPQATDPIQRNMMMALPVIFTVMFLNFPSGLVIYWLVNNVLTIGQQWHINKNEV